MTLLALLVLPYVSQSVCLSVTKQYVYNTDMGVQKNPINYIHTKFYR
jgi:hypothetical protein